MADEKKHLRHKAVIFNVEDPYQFRLLEHAELHPNFSGYVKRLIQRDMEANTGIIYRNPPPQDPVKKDDGIDANGFI